jgi:hypothetical protein
MDPIYKTYSDYIDQIVNINTSNFKSVEQYTYMLEHVNYEQGKKYLECINNNFSFFDRKKITEITNLNDRIGHPILCEYDEIRCSPTSLRYIYQSLLILDFMKSIYTQQPVNIIEIGGGYGGLCLVLKNIYTKYYQSHFKLNRYSIIDLPNPNKLQRKYFDYHEINCDLFSAYDYNVLLEKNKDCSNFLISNYCFSEIGENNQKEYIKTLFPIIDHGFITWNMIDVYDFGKKIIKQVRETPLTGNKNYYVYF